MKTGSVFHMPCKECYLPLYTIFAGQCEIKEVRKPQEFDIRAILRNKCYEPHQCSPELMSPCLDSPLAKGSF